MLKEIFILDDYVLRLELVSPEGFFGHVVHKVRFPPRPSTNDIPVAIVEAHVDQGIKNYTKRHWAIQVLYDINYRIDENTGRTVTQEEYKKRFKPPPLLKRLSDAFPTPQPPNIDGMVAFPENTGYWRLREPIVKALFDNELCSAPYQIHWGMITRTIPVASSGVYFDDDKP